MLYEVQSSNEFMKARLDKNFKRAIDGITICIHKKDNLKIYIVIGNDIVCQIVSCISYFEWMIYLLLFTMVISLALMNTTV